MALLGSLATVGALGGLGFAYLRSKTDDVFRDLNFALLFMKLGTRLNGILKQNKNAVDAFLETVQQHPKKEAIRYLKDNGKVRSLTWEEVDKLSNKVAHWALNEGVKPRDVVVLLMDNRPEFIVTWLGLAKAGAIISLINTNLKGEPLRHTLTLCKAKYFVIGSEHAQRVLEVREVGGGASAEGLPVNGRWYLSGPNKVKIGSKFEDFDVAVAVNSPDPPPEAVRRTILPSDTLFYIYTSGTTGLPKASIITHLRFQSAYAFVLISKATVDDKIYCVLPLYHSAGGMIGVGLSLFTGATLVLRRKFSSRNFWKDVSENSITTIQYIGELCRYLVSNPASPYDTKHSLRVAIGNGLRPDVWPVFVSRFKIPNIVEFYAATEGTVAVANNLNKVGAVGFIPPLLKQFHPARVIKFDVQNEQPVRGADGFCIQCAPGEVGELIGLIKSDDPLKQFKGYTNKKATEKKVLRDVFAKGDSYFRTGDLLRIENDGFLYFVDRIGDTFRWKGENVATSEVAEVMSKIPGVLEVNVYGVEVPGHDGRAGMACVVFSDKPDFAEVYRRLFKDLAAYAVPMFIRVKKSIETTTTFKHKKADLVKEGFNINQIKDSLYLRDDKQKTYVSLTPKLFQDLNEPKLASRL